eukprot:scaffold74798_cov18-Tisochrysis_lutea.AAC.1
MSGKNLSLEEKRALSGGRCRLERKEKGRWQEVDGSTNKDRREEKSQRRRRRRGAGRGEREMRGRGG